MVLLHTVFYDHTDHSDEGRREGGREGGREEEQLERGKEEKKGNEKEQEHEGIDMERYLSHLED